MSEENKQKPPRVFISYSHDNKEHKAWVLQLAARLRANGVDAVLDEWDLPLGGNLPYFMEHGLTDADRILAVCSEEYVRKANEGQGGVSYEKTILADTLMKNIESERIIPILRANPAKSLPTFLSGRFYADFNADADYESAYGKVLREIHKIPAYPRPTIGSNPFAAGSVDRNPRPAFSPARYVSPALEGRISFDYSNNNGNYTLGARDLTFTTKWSKASDTSIHAYNDASDIASIALVKDIASIADIKDAAGYDNSSRSRSPRIGQIIIWQNTAGYYCATKIEAIADDSRGAAADNLTFSYKILQNKGVDFTV